MLAFSSLLNLGQIEKKKEHKHEIAKETKRRTININNTNNHSCTENITLICSGN